MKRKRNLAFFKVDKSPWTVAEYKKICEFCGDTQVTNHELFLSHMSSYSDDGYKYIFDSGEKKPDNHWFMHNWANPDGKHSNLPNCTKYEFSNFFYKQEVIPIKLEKYL